MKEFLKTVAFAAAIRRGLLCTASDECNGSARKCDIDGRGHLLIDRFRDALDVGTGRLFAANQFR
jgi:hypothetical protein